MFKIPELDAANGPSLQGKKSGNYGWWLHFMTAFFAGTEFFGSIKFFEYFLELGSNVG
jgi:hypothetical protein